MRTNSIFIAHVAEAIADTAHSAADGAAVADFRVFTPWPSAGHGPTASVTRTGEPNISVQSTSRAARQAGGRSRASAADEAATCGSVSAFAVAVPWCPG